ARLINAERKFNADLGVIRCTGGSPLQWFDAAGQPWVNPSPNIRNLTEATLYPAVGLLEFCKLSVGRGTDTPFELLGAPYIDDMKLAAALNHDAPTGVRFVPTRFTPEASVFDGVECRGVQLTLTNRDHYRSSQLNRHLAATLHRMYGKQLDLPKMARLLGDEKTLQAILGGKTTAEIEVISDRLLQDFQKRREPFLLYPR
ncbi:DUF1343 domain-containing protein, partial [Akkermansiaceae bacterium]|nr:DUF1343 domain-containing protein [Akkermansiaceae bacterium]